MLTTGELYSDLGGDYYRKRDPERTTKRLVTQLEASDTPSHCKRQWQPERYFPVSGVGSSTATSGR